MNEDVVKFLFDRFPCRSLGENTYHITLPLFYPETETQFVLGVQMNNHQLILSDLGEFVSKVYMVKPTFFLEDETKKILEKYDAKYENGKILMEGFTDEIQSAISEFCFLLVVLTNKLV